MERFCRQAVAAVKATGEVNYLLNRPTEFLVEEFRWLAQNGIRSLADYLDAEDVGRAGSRVSPGDRPAVFSVYESYRALRDSSGKPYDWDDLAQAVLSELESDADVRYYRHVIIDEGQDFSPVMIRSLAAAIPEDGSLTFFGDMAQQIYGNRISWRTAGLSVRDREVWKFEENYRNTKQIAQLALAIAKAPHYRGVADLVEPKSPAADGPLPALVAFGSEDDEMRFVVERAQKLALTGTVAVLFRDRALEKRLPPLPSATRLHRDLGSWPAGPRLFYGTYHSAKGLEFDSVLIPFASDSRLPHPPDIAAFGLNEACVRDAKLLYVAVTRAKLNLILTHSGDPTPLLPIAARLLQRSRR